MNHTEHATPHAMQPYWNLLLASVQADGLRVALELNLLEALPATSADTAARINTDTDATTHLLDLLWSMHLLDRSDTENVADRIYTPTAMTHDYLLRAAPTCCADAWMYRLHALRQSGAALGDRLKASRVSVEAFLPRVSSAPASTLAAATVPASVVPASSSPPNRAAMGKLWADAARAQIGQEQRAITIHAARRILATLPDLASATRFLDLGGGPGWVAIALAEDYPQLGGAVFDWPETAAVAHENIIRSGLGSRLSAFGGDIADGNFGSGYDVIWCASVLHFVPDVAATLRSIHAALRPGGILVCAQAEISATASEAAAVLPYYLSLLMAGRHVGTEGEMTEAMQCAGFNEIENFQAHDFPMAPVGVWVARRKFD